MGKRNFFSSIFIEYFCKLSLSVNSQLGTFVSPFLVLSYQFPQGTARCQQGIPTSPDGYPEEFEYDENEQMLRVGEGEFSPIYPEVWGFSVSGLQVVKSWLNYRKKSGYGRRSSPLDDIRPESWTTQMTQELLKLLWVLEHTLSAYPELNTTLRSIIQSECFTEDELPTPSDDQRDPPSHREEQESITL